MKCKRCRKEVPDGSRFCNWCGAPQDAKKMYRRPDGLYEKIIVLNGKRVAFRGKTEADVFKRIAEHKESVSSGPLFKEVAERWYNEHFQAIAYNSQRAYNPCYDRAVENFGDKPTKNILAPDVKKYVAGFPKTWAYKTSSNYLLVLNLILSFAASDGVIDHNPAEYIQLPKGLKRGHRRAPTPEEIRTIKVGVDQPFGLFAFFLLYTGCRRGEALALQYKDVDRESKVIHITKSVYHDGQTPKVKKPKTENGKRDIILLDVLSEKIPKGEPNDYVFGENGSMLSASRIERLWKDYQKTTGLIDITPHVVRHGYATMLHEAGIDIKDSQEMLGHANISTTLDIYTHITKNRMAQTAQKLNDYIKNTQ